MGSAGKKPLHWCFPLGLVWMSPLGTRASSPRRGHLGISVSGSRQANPARSSVGHRAQAGTASKGLGPESQQVAPSGAAGTRGVRAWPGLGAGVRAVPPARCSITQGLLGRGLVAGADVRAQELTLRAAAGPPPLR